MLILKDLPWLLTIFLAVLLILSGLGTLSILQAINGHPHSNRWAPGRLFIAGLVGLILVAFVALLLVSLFSF